MHEAPTGTFLPRPNAEATQSIIYNAIPLRYHLRNNFLLSFVQLRDEILEGPDPVPVVPPEEGGEEIEEDEEEEDRFINNSPEQLDNVTFQGGLLFDGYNYK
jgi:hypothetical protein